MYILVYIFSNYLITNWNLSIHSNNELDALMWLLLTTHKYLSKLLDFYVIRIVYSVDVFVQTIAFGYAPSSFLIITNIYIVINSINIWHKHQSISILQVSRMPAHIKCTNH